MYVCVCVCVCVQVDKRRKVDAENGNEIAKVLEGKIHRKVRERGTERVRDEMQKNKFCVLIIYIVSWFMLF